MGIETVLMGAGLGMNAASAYGNSKNAKGAAGAQEQVARNNAVIAGWQADDAIMRGDRQASAVRGKGQQLKGRQRAAMAANGVDLGVGSALNILDDTDQFTQIDVNTVKDNAGKEAWALRNQANGFSFEAGMAKARGDAESPLLAAGTSLLTGAGKVAGRWYSAGGTK